MPFEPSWMKIARSYLGEREIKGPKHNSKIVQFWIDMKASFRDDETAWCGAFVGGVMAEAGFKPYPQGAAARAWRNFGYRIEKPAVGCIVVFWRGSKDGYSGHVGFVVGQDQAGNLMVLGGNQGDMVSIKPFDTDRVLGYVYPTDLRTASFVLPVYKSDGRLSSNEA
jgi:uncharacterized protein (TIGR02594 family)